MSYENAITVRIAKGGSVFVGAAIVAVWNEETDTHAMVMPSDEEREKIARLLAPHLMDEREAVNLIAAKNYVSQKVASVEVDSRD